MLNVLNIVKQHQSAVVWRPSASPYQMSDHDCTLQKTNLDKYQLCHYRPKYINRYKVQENEVRCLIPHQFHIKLTAHQPVYCKHHYTEQYSIVQTLPPFCYCTAVLSIGC